MAQIHVQFVRSNIARNNDQSFFLADEMLVCGRFRSDE